MLDLSRPLGSVEGLTLFGDHERPALVYYLPDEIDLRRVDGRPDLALAIYLPDQALTGPAADLSRAVGAILGLGVRCGVGAERLARARAALASQLARDDLELVAPPWERGTVDLVLLDAQRGEATTTAVRDDAAVLGVVGSRSPSLTDGELSAFFHARLDQRGAALMTAALEGRAGSLAGVLYDLEFAALRPAVDLVMRADLRRVADFLKTSLGVQAYYVAADVGACFGQMREKGVISVDMVSQAADAETQRLVDQAAKDFYDVLMRELFKPTVSPAETLGGVLPSLTAPATAVVRLSLTYVHTEHQREVRVDYRRRSATTRRHNPASRLARLADVAGGAASLTTRVPLSTAWREAGTVVSVVGGFEDPSLDAVEVVVWRGREAVLDEAHARDGGLRLPERATPLADLTISRADGAPRALRWIYEPDEPPFFRWQARMLYRPQDGVDSPVEVWSEPRASSSSDLPLFPDLLAPLRRVRLTLGPDHDADLIGVEARIVARDAAGSVVAERTLTIDPSHPSAAWGVRRRAPPTLEAALVFRWSDGRRLSLPPRAVLDADLPVNRPFMDDVTLVPLVVGAPPGLVEVDLLTEYRAPAFGYAATSTTRLRPPDYRGADIRVPVLRSGDEVSWRVLAVAASGEVRTAASGASAGGTLMINLAVGTTVHLEWIGPSPREAGARYVRVSLRAVGADGVVTDTKTVEWRGEDTGARAVVLAGGARIEWSSERRYDNGQVESQPFAGLNGDTLPVSA